MGCQFVFNNADNANDFINKLKSYFKTHDSISEGFMDDIVSHYYPGAAIIDEYTVIGSPETILKKPINIEFISTPLGHAVTISEKLDDD